MGAPSAGGGVDASSSGIAGLGDIFGLSQTPAYVPAQEVSEYFPAYVPAQEVSEHFPGLSL